MLVQNLLILLFPFGICHRLLVHAGTGLRACNRVALVRDDGDLDIAGRFQHLAILQCARGVSVNTEDTIVNGQAMKLDIIAKDDKGVEHKFTPRYITYLPIEEPIVLYNDNQLFTSTISYQDITITVGKVDVSTYYTNHSKLPFFIWESL